MKLTPVQLYTVNHHGPDALPEDVAVWAASPGEAATRLLENDITAFDRMVHVMRTGLDFTFRIDPDPAPKPAQGWVAGAPPLIDGAWFLVMHQGEPVAVHCHAPNDLPWTDSAGNDYPSSEFTNHLPTPIQPPKES